MNAVQFHDRLYDAGIRLVKDGATLSADVLPGVDPTPFLDQIRELSPELRKAADLRERIIAAAMIDPREFNRVAYDLLWEEWRDL